MVICFNLLLMIKNKCKSKFQKKCELSSCYNGCSSVRGGGGPCWKKKNVWIIIEINWDQLIKKSSPSMRLWGILFNRQIGSKDMHCVPGNKVQRYPILHYFLQVFFELEQNSFLLKNLNTKYFLSNDYQSPHRLEKTLISSSGLMCAPTRSAIRIRQNVRVFGEYSLFFPG